MAKKKRRKRSDYGKAPEDFAKRIAKDLGTRPDDPQILRIIAIMQEILDDHLR